MLAEGRTNRQIGQALFISAKTVGIHVSSILAKLGVTSRVDAAAVAHRGELLYFNPRVGMRWMPADHPEDAKNLICHFSQLPAERSLLTVMRHITAVTRVTIPRQDDNLRVLSEAST